MVHSHIVSYIFCPIWRLFAHESNIWSNGKHSGNDPGLEDHGTTVGFVELTDSVTGKKRLHNKFLLHIFDDHSDLFDNDGVREIQAANIRPAKLSKKRS